jgi:hypothetical protein
MKRNAYAQGEIIAKKKKYTDTFLKIVSWAWASWPISIKHGINYFWVKGILNRSKGQILFKGEIIAENWVGSFKNLLKKHWAIIGHIYMKAFWCNVDSKLFTSLSPGVWRGHNRENHIYICLYWKWIFSRTSWRISIKLGTNHPWVKGILNCSNKGSDPL